MDKAMEYLESRLSDSHKFDEFWEYKIGDKAGITARPIDFGGEIIVTYGGTDVSFYMKNSTGSLKNVVSSGGGFNQNEWNHIVVTFDRINDSLGNAVLYKNGEIVKIGSITNPKKGIGNKIYKEYRKKREVSGN